jgi:hypothetical protein
MASASPVVVLRFVRGKYQGQEFALEAGKAIIAGRSTEADLVLSDDAVSRKHARFHAARGRIWVRDLGSSLARIETKDAADVAQRKAGEQRRRRPNDAAGRSMTGSIEDIPLMDVLQWLATSRKTGCLKVRDVDRGRVGALHLREGRVYYAEIVGNRLLHPEKALLRMLLWDKGMFELENTSIENPPIEINMPLEHMLMEAARQQDEVANLAKKVSLPAYGQPVSVVRPSPTRWSKLAANELDILQDIVEAGGWWEVMDGSTTDDVSMMKLLVALRNKGVVAY